MLSIQEIIKIARNYIRTVTKGECDIFHDFHDFETGILFNYQSKEYIEGNKRAVLYGNHNPFIIGKEDGLVYHIIGENVNEEETIHRFLENKIKGVSLDELTGK